MGRGASAGSAVVDSDITVPTSFANRNPGGCSYEVRGRVRVSAAMTVAAGTSMRFAQDSILQITEGGSIRAVGTADDPVLLAGAQNVAGYWAGLCFEKNQPSRLENVIILNAGKVWAGGSAVCRAGIGGVHDVGTSSAGAPVDIVNTAVIGSATVGLDATTVTLGEFRNNIFAANAEYGVRLGAANLGKLDAGSDYLGVSVDKPNGLPYIYLYGTMPEGARGSLVGTNAPYYVGEDLVSSASPYKPFTLNVYGQLAVGPGVRFVFGKDGGVNVHGEVMVSGVEASPATFVGRVEQRGSWAGFWVPSGGHLELDHVLIRWAGGDYLYSGSVVFNRRSSAPSSGRIANTTIEGSAGCAIDLGASTNSIVLDSATIRVGNNEEDLCT